MSILFGTIRARLILGLSMIVILLIIAGSVGRIAISGLSDEMARSLDAVRHETGLTSTLTTSVSQELAAASRYLERGDPADLALFRQSGWDAHEAQRELNGSPGLTSTEIALVAAIDERLSGLEAGLAASHRMRDLGRLAAAQTRAASVRDAEIALSEDIDRLTQMRSRQLDRVTATMRDVAARRQRFLLAVILGAILFGVAIVVSTVR